MILAILIIVVFLLLDRVIEHATVRKVHEELSNIDMKLMVMKMHLESADFMARLNGLARKSEKEKL